MRKKIAVLVAQVDEAMQTAFLTGFIKEAHAHDYDVCIFAMYQKFQANDRRNVGDSNIYNLINYALFDAVVILSDTILVPDLCDSLQKHIKSTFDGPVITIDVKSDYFESIMMDHYTPFRKIVDHMIEVHGYQKMAFFGGKKDHPYSVQRLNAFLDSMKEHDVPVNEDWIFHGNYWYNTAEAFVDTLLNDKENFPRAIVCANDIMAIGAASRLVDNGYRVPEDVAVTGYDSIDAGRTSPIPITSCAIAFDESGEYAARWIISKINGKTIEPFKCHSPICIGGSCGCHYEFEMVPETHRNEWKTDLSSRSMFSDVDHMLEDLLSMNRLPEFLKVISNHAYQIMPFESFDFCLNDGFMRPDTFVGDKAIRKGYADDMYSVLSVDGNGETIDFKRSFKSHMLTPRLHEERDYPSTFIFNSLYSEDRCYGYTVLNYGEKATVYDGRFRTWMRDVMQGMEAFYRQGYMLSLMEKIKSDQIRDSLTGLYNYDGFYKAVTENLLTTATEDNKISILSIDIKDTRQINELYGRDAGRHAIKTVANFIIHSVGEHDIACRMYNDEFIIALLDDENSTRSLKVVHGVEGRLKKYGLLTGTNNDLKIHYYNLLAEQSEMDNLELLVNQTISLKNHKKSSTSSSGDSTNLKDEIKRNKIVTNILNKNLFTYYYQPIISAVDGSVYAYEALMRCEQEKISPFQILQAATYLDRLSDVEKYTLLNVTSDVESRLDEFGDAKVFINSLSGIELSDNDESKFADRVMHNNGRFVIEFTEESQLDDNQLQDIKNKYSRYGCRIAVDDYGTGYSNVNNLLRYKPQYVKIDRSLISEIHINPQKQHFVRSIITFAHENDIQALAEGVETREELYECLKFGVDLIQGYYTGRPQPDPIIEIDPIVKSAIEGFRLQNVGWEY